MLDRFVMPEDQQTNPQAENIEDNTSVSDGGLLASAGRMLALTGPVSLPLRHIRKAGVALRNRDYRVYWIGSLCSNMGSWVQNVAKAWLVYEISGSVYWLGVDALATHGSALLLPLGGALADRFDRRKLLIATNAMLALFSVLLAVLYATGVLAVWHIIAISALGGVLQSVMVPANQALVSILVPREDLPNAVALNAIQFNLSRAIGPALGGLLLITLGATWAFSINTLTFLALIVACLVIHARPEVKHHTMSVLQSMAQGIGYLRSRPDLVVILGMVVTCGLLGAPVMTMLPAIASDGLGGSESQYSLLLSAFGVGSLVGASMLAARSDRGPTPWRAFPLIVGVGASLVALSLAPSFTVALPIMSFCGMMFVGVMNRLVAAVLTSVPDEVRGRISSLTVLAFRGGLPVGSFLAGYLATYFGVMRVVGFYGIALCLAAPTLLLIVRRGNVVYQSEGHAGSVG